MVLTHLPVTADLHEALGVVMTLARCTCPPERREPNGNSDRCAACALPLTIPAWSLVRRQDWPRCGTCECVRVVITHEGLRCALCGDAA